MKHATLLLLVMLLASQAFGQKKKNKKDATDPVADTIAQVMPVDTLEAVPVAIEVSPYQAMYDTLCTKVFKYAFDPARMSLLVDSLSMQRESAFAGLNATSASLMDSVSVLHAHNAELQAHVDQMNAERAAHAERTAVITELKQWKVLLDELVITQDEYNAQKKKLLDAL